MKKALLPLMALVFIVLSCSKVKQLTQVEVDIPYTQTLDASKFPDKTHYPVLPFGGIRIDFPTIPVTTNSQQYLDQNNTTVNKINSVTLKSVLLQLTAPQGKYLDFLKSVSLSISSDTLAMIRIAHKENIPKGQTSIYLDDTAANLTKYFLEKTIYVNITATFDSIPPPGTAINTITTFHLSANPLN